MTDIRLPQAGMGMTDGTVLRWLKNEGDQVEEGEILCEIETAKTTIELEAPEAGVLARVIVQADENVPVDTILAILESPGQTSAVTKQPRTHSEAPGAERSTGSPTARRSAPAGRPRVQIAPSARRAARELDVDLAEVAGSGPNGRILLEDVRAHAAKPKSEGAAADSLSEPGYEEKKVSMMRRTIARRLTESKQQAPHFYLTTRCELDALIAMREERNSRGEARISVNDLVVKAVALALQEVPEANVLWGESVMRHYSRSDVAVAVATPKGLVTPVVRDADKKTVSQIAAEMTDLAQRAREFKLRPEEYEGGTTTVSNLGMYAVEVFSAIINPPHSTIFAIGSATESPVIRDGQVQAATLMSVTVSADHRAVDGAVAAELLAAFKRLIEAPERLVAE